MTLRWNLLRCHLSAPSLVELHAYAPRFVREPSDRPIASPWARAVARSRRKVTNLRLESIGLDDRMRALLCLLDGTRERAALVDSIEGSTERPREAAVENALQALARAALLIA